MEKQSRKQIRKRYINEYSMWRQKTEKTYLSDIKDFGLVVWDLFDYVWFKLNGWIELLSSDSRCNYTDKRGLYIVERTIDGVTLFDREWRFLREFKTPTAFKNWYVNYGIYLDTTNRIDGEFR